MILVCPECRRKVEVRSLAEEADRDSFMHDGEPIEDYFKICYHKDEFENRMCPGVGQTPLPIEIY